MFFLAVCGAFYFAMGDRYLAMAVMGLLAGLTRSIGFILVIPLLIKLVNLRLHKPYISYKVPAPMLSFVLAPAIGLFIYMAYLWIDFGNPLAFKVSAAHWGREITWPWISIAHGIDMFSQKPFYSAWFLGFTILAVVLGV